MLLTAAIDQQRDSASDEDFGDDDGEPKESSVQKLKLLVSIPRKKRKEDAADSRPAGRHLVVLLNEACESNDEPVCVQIPPHRLGREDIMNLRDLLGRYPGPVPTEAVVTLDGCRCHVKLAAELTVQPGPELNKALDAWAS